MTPQPRDTMRGYRGAAARRTCELVEAEARRALAIPGDPAVEENCVDAVRRTAAERDEGASRELSSCYSGEVLAPIGGATLPG